MGTASGINPKTPRRSSTQTNTHSHTHNTIPTHLHHVTKAAYKRPLHMARAQPPAPRGGGLRIIPRLRGSGEPPQRTNAYQGFLTALQGGCWHHGATAYLYRKSGRAATVPRRGPGRAEQIPPARHDLACASARHPLHHRTGNPWARTGIYPEQFGIGQSPRK